jgi:hypothetical protein
MAKEKVNKSGAIRDYYSANPTAKAKEVVAGLAEKGVKVNEGLVYAVKGAMKERKNRKKRVAKAAMAAVGGTTVGNGILGKTDALTMIRDVKSLAERAGGYKKLKELVEELAG